MPEYDQKERKLPGETTVTPSSDEAKIATIEGLRGDALGLPDPEIVLEGEPLNPVLATSFGKDMDDEGPGTKVVDIKPRLDHSSSGFGLLIWQERTKKRAA